jgi:hypothetical protein
MSPAEDGEVTRWLHLSLRDICKQRARTLRKVASSCARRVCLHGRAASKFQEVDGHATVLPVAWRLSGIETSSPHTALFVFAKERA